MSVSSFRLSSAVAVAVVLAASALTTTSLTAQTTNGTPIGHFDVAGCDTIAGWAADPNSPNQPIQVHIYAGGQAGLGGTMLGAWNADVYRGDVAASGMAGNGVHGFYFPVPNNLKDGQVHPIYVYAINMQGTPGSNALLVGSPQNIQCGPYPIGGQNDQVSCNDMGGWVCDPNNLSPTQVHFYVNGPAGQGQLMGGTVADKPREALIGYYCGGTTNHGYSFSVPQQYRDGQPHFVYAYGIDSNNVPLSNSQLGNSPRTFQCTPTATTSSSSSSSSVVSSSSSSVSSGPLPGFTQCSDLYDNDGDGLTDNWDPGCWGNTSDAGTYNPAFNNEAAAGLPGTMNLSIGASTGVGQPSSYPPGQEGSVKLNFHKAGVLAASHVYYLITLPPELSHTTWTMQHCQTTSVQNEFKCLFSQQAFTQSDWSADAPFKVNLGQCGKTVSSVFTVGSDTPETTTSDNTTSFPIVLAACSSSSSSVTNTQSSSSTSVSSSSSSVSSTSSVSSYSSSSPVTSASSSVSSSISSTSGSSSLLGIRVVPTATSAVYPNTFFSYQVYLKNNGQQPMSNISVQANLPPDSQFWPNYSGDTQFCVSDASGVICPWAITLQPGIEQYITLTFKALTCTTQASYFNYQASATAMMGAQMVASETEEGAITKSCGASGSGSSLSSSLSSSSTASSSSSASSVSSISSSAGASSVSSSASSASTSLPAANIVLYTLQYHAGQQQPIAPGQNGILDISVINHGPAVSIHPYALITFSSGLTSMLPTSWCTATGQANQFKCVFPDLVDEQTADSTIPFKVNADQCGQTPSLTVAIGSDNATAPLASNTTTFTVATTPCASSSSSANPLQVAGDITTLFLGFRNSYNFSQGQQGYDATFDFNDDGTVNQTDFASFKLLTQCPTNPSLMSIVRVYSKLTQGFRNTFGFSKGMPGFKPYFDFDHNDTVDLADFARLSAILQKLFDCLVQGIQTQGIAP